MKKQLLLSALLIGSLHALAQDLPANPEPGKCYVRCTTPDVYENVTEEVMTKPAYKKLTVVPAEYKTITEEVMIKAPSTRLEVIPAVYETETISYVKKEKANKLSTTPASFTNDAEVIEIKAAYAQWELGAAAPDCESSNPDDCRYWCYKGYPAEYETVNVKRLGADASESASPIAEQTATYTKRVVKTPATTREIEIPAEYGTITKRVLVKDAYTTEETVPAQYKTVSKEVLKTKGGLTEWKEVDCGLLEYNDLNINWDLGSATLTPQAKAEIDAKLLPVMAEGVSVEIASHTDSRGSKESNRLLSERRAQAVTNYLISKGINTSRITSNGYGESRLLNRCSDGVSCTEREHRMNRRTQFRVIQ